MVTLSSGLVGQRKSKRRGLTVKAPMAWEHCNLCDGLPGVWGKLCPNDDLLLLVSCL